LHVVGRPQKPLLVVGSWFLVLAERNRASPANPALGSRLLALGRFGLEASGFETPEGLFVVTDEVGTANQAAAQL